MSIDVNLNRVLRSFRLPSCHVGEGSVLRPSKGFDISTEFRLPK